MLLSCSEQDSWVFGDGFNLTSALYDETFIWDVRIATTRRPKKRVLVMRNRATGLALLLDVSAEILQLHEKRLLAALEGQLKRQDLPPNVIAQYVKSGQRIAIEINQTPPYAKRKVAELTKWVESVNLDQAMDGISERPVVFNRQRIDARALFATQIAEQKDEIIKKMHSALIVHVGLHLFSPSKVWRRFLIPMNTSFENMHTIIQEGFGWEGNHLHEFQVGENIRIRPKKEVEAAREWSDHFQFINEDEIFIRQLSTPAFYRYDFGDDWLHTLRVVQRVLVDEVPAPLCIDGAGDCPWEDSGGAFGYAQILDTLDDEDDPEYEDMLEWAEEMGEGIPFDKHRINRRLSSIFSGVQPTTWI